MSHDERQAEMAENDDLKSGGGDGDGETTASGRNLVRRRVSIPEADTSTLSWWSLQADPALSVRLLIRDEIERSGYLDYANRPVSQKPKVGRPAKSAEPAAAVVPDPVPGTNQSKSNSTDSGVLDFDDDDDQTEEITGLHSQIANRTPDANHTGTAKPAPAAKQSKTKQDAPGMSNDDLLDLMSNRD